MKTLYIECKMGAAGDMLMGALIELIPDPNAFISKMNSLGIPGVQLSKETSMKCGVSGTHITVTVGGKEEESLDLPHHTHATSPGHPLPLAHNKRTRQTLPIAKLVNPLHLHQQMHSEQSNPPHSHPHEHPHDHSHDHPHNHDNEEHSHTTPHSGATMGEIEALIHSLPLSQTVRTSALAVYQLLAQAESKSHNVPVQKVHFSEVGTMDAVADIVGVCLLMEEIHPDQVLASPIHLGSGKVLCSHGILPVPAPATAHILKGVPTYTGDIQGELCTPTGAALLKYFATSFGPQPPLTVTQIGYGMGSKDFPMANCVRVFLGHTSQSPTTAYTDEVVQLSCNLDDCTGESLGYIQNLLLESGALDVFFTSIQMKKNRPGQMLTCLCSPSQEEALTNLILRHTTTFGVRRNLCGRYLLSRKFHTLKTPYGDIRIKSGEGYGIHKSKPEYEDVVKAAQSSNLPLSEIYKTIAKLTSQE